MAILLEAFLEGIRQCGVLREAEVIVAGEIVAQSTAVRLWRKFPPQTCLANFFQFLIDAPHVAERTLPVMGEMFQI